jgi:hypothetical protein
MAILDILEPRKGGNSVYNASAYLLEEIAADAFTKNSLRQSGLELQSPQE